MQDKTLGQELLQLCERDGRYGWPYPYTYGRLGVAVDLFGKGLMTARSLYMMRAELNLIKGTYDNLLADGKTTKDAMTEACAITFPKVRTGLRTARAEER